MIIGHQKQWYFLKKSAERGKVPHGYLFCGPERLGKKTLALEFIKLLECEKGVFQGPCQKCPSCLQIKKRIHPDLILVEPQGKEIKINQIRELAWKLSLRPYSGPFKAAVIDQAHEMNQEAQTCLLKTLEEPRGKTILILISEYPQILFPTILSRVQKIRFQPVKKSEIINYLKEKGVADKEIEEIAELFPGRPGEVKEFLSAPQKIEVRKKAIGDLIKIWNSDLVWRFQYVKSLSEEPQDFKEILEAWTFYLRNNLIRQLNGKENLFSPAGERTPNHPIGKLKDVLQRIQGTSFLISTTNVNPRLALEILMMEL